MQSAKYADQAELLSLNNEFSTISESLRKKDEGFKEKVPRLCNIIKRRLELADPTLIQDGFAFAFAVNQISTELSRYATRKGWRIAKWIHDYCPPEFKDESKIHKNLSDVRAVEPRAVDLLIGFGEKEREILEQIETVSNADLDALYTLCAAKIKNKCESVARDRNVLLTGHENREKFRTRKPPPKITEYWRSIEWFRMGPLLKYQEFVRQFPPPADREQSWIEGILEWGNIYDSIVNLKASLTLVMWITRIKYMVHQSKHGAAVFEPVETEICDNCWDDKLGKEREGCNAEMLYDYDSPTKWRCGTCGGISGKTRTLTREQCGDNKNPILTYAQKLIGALPNIFESHVFYASDAMKRIYERKIKLGYDLSKKA